MARTKKVVNTSTGEVWTVAFSSAEEAARDAEEAQVVIDEAAWIAAEPDRVQAHIASDPYLKTIAEMLWQIAKAANTNNWSAFKLNDDTPVTNKTQFMQYAKETFQRV